MLTLWVKSIVDGHRDVVYVWIKKAAQDQPLSVLLSDAMNVLDTMTRGEFTLTSWKLEPPGIRIAL